MKYTWQGTTYQLENKTYMVQNQIYCCSRTRHFYKPKNHTVLERIVDPNLIDYILGNLSEKEKDGIPSYTEMSRRAHE